MYFLSFNKSFLSSIEDTKIFKSFWWLLRRGPPLPIPNREVKPACADGTAVMWESMSSPFFIEPQSEKIGVLFLLERRVLLTAQFVAFV